jgi:hypothetical protein
MTEPAVRSVLTRARKALRKEYASRGGTLPVGGLAILAPWVAGLGWADRLRRVASKVSAPAALSAVGITALGGLVLSPFSVLPHQDGSTFTPSTAVVSTAVTPVADTTPKAPVSVSRDTVKIAPSTRTGVLGRALEQLPKTTPCVNDTDADDGHSSLPVTLGSEAPTAGSSSCDTAEATHGDSLTVSPALPDNPSGIRYVTVTSDFLTCATVPVTPLITCTPDTNPGAPK